MKTLTETGINKIAQRFIGDLSHAAYDNGQQSGELPIFRSFADGNIVRVYVYFDDQYSGEIGTVRLIDKDGDVVAQTVESIVKPSDKGFYVAFKYKLVEVEVEASVESL